MHSDVYELFIIVNSVPVLHLTQETAISSSDTVLKAGRISAQDMLGEETTGELIQKEVLTESTISYARKNDILIALRVSNSMSQEGANALLADILLLIEGNINIVYNSFGDKSILDPLIKRLEITLGAKLPTDPFTLASINDSMQKYLQSILYIDTIGIVTQESWLVNVASREDRQTEPLNKDIWKKTVEILHNALGMETKGLLIEDENSVFWIRPIFYKNPRTKQGIAWWALLVQVNTDVLQNLQPTMLKASTTFRHSSALSAEAYHQICQDLDWDLYPNLESLLRTMVERETRNIARQGLLGQILTFSEQVVNDPLFLEITYPSEQKMYSEAIFVLSDDGSGSWLDLIYNYQGEHRQKFPEHTYIFNQKSTIFCTLHEQQIFDLLKAFKAIALQQHDTTTKIHLSIEDNAALDTYANILLELTAANVPTSIYSETLLNYNNPADCLQIIDEISSESQIRQYVFVILENSLQSIAFVFFKETSDLFTGIWTHSADIIDLIFSRVSNLGEMT